jgi:hypothetical protein
VAMAIAAGATVTAAAQDKTIRIEQKIVVPQEVLTEIHRITREIISQQAFRDLGRELGREIGRSMETLGRELGHLSAQPHAEGTFVQNRDFKAEKTDTQTKTLAIGPTGSLQLHNIVGNITVKAGGGREASVEIVRVSRGRTDADAQQGLDRVTVEVTTRGERGSVMVHYPDERRPAHSVAVHFNATVPPGTALAIHSITGNVTIANVKGELTVNTVNGGIDISQAAAIASAHTVSGKLVVNGFQGDGPVEVGTMNGSVALSNIKAKRLEVSTVSGHVSAREIQAGGAEVTCMSCHIEYSGGVTPSGRYEFQAHSGQIRLGLSGNFDFEGGTFSGKIDSDPALGLSKPSGRRHSIKGTVGSGGAFVEATTFSGSVWIGRKLN